MVTGADRSRSVAVGATRFPDAARGSDDRACGTLYDMIDLAVVRRDHFRLVGFDVEAVLMPGDALQTLEKRITIEVSLGGMPTFDLYRAGQVRIRPPVLVNTARRIACLSRYRVSMTLEGPRGCRPLRRSTLTDQHRYRPVAVNLGGASSRQWLPAE